ncbi:hypothetical protein BOX15_Mlig028484g1 [Macrostomum lignano]|uniref:BHLH domain-containing protein n=1 Tax=Macrostomum lignano TaxID=282301 RepID=A0A267FFT8_9PLAT|nr:hypothetical protein BOX15_Mlig028484g1 [Macrostomum lignano]
MDTGNGEDSMSFLLDLISSDAGNVQQHQDEPMMDAASGAGHLQQHQSTALEDIEPSYDLFQFPTSVANDSNGTATSASILWQQLTMPQPQEPSMTSNTSNSAFQQYRSHSSCSSYSNFSSSVPSVASTPSLLSGFSTPAHPREWTARPTVYGASSAAAVRADATAAAAVPVDPDERRRRYADVNSLSRQELFDTLNRRLRRVGSSSGGGFGDGVSSPSDTSESPRWQQQQQHHHHSGGSGGATSSSSSAAGFSVGGAASGAAAAVSVADNPDVVDLSAAVGVHLKDEPATPPSTPSRLPRHQREPHKKAEKKRVEKIRQRLDQLRELCGIGGGGGGGAADRSEAKLLTRVLGCIRELQLANRRSADEANALQARLSELESEQKTLLEALDDEAAADHKVDADGDSAIEDFSGVKFESGDEAGTPSEDCEMTSETTITHDCRQGLRFQVVLQQRQHQLLYQKSQSESNSLSAGLEAYSRDRLTSGDPGAVLFHRLIGGLLVDSFRRAVLGADCNEANGAAVANGNGGDAGFDSVEFREKFQRWLSTLTASRLRRDLNQRLNEVAADFV